MNTTSAAGTAETDTTTIRYRPATAADLEAITVLLEGADLPAREVEPFIRSFMVAEVDGKLVACGGLEVRGNTAVLRSVAVDASMRGSGVGRTLSQQLVELATGAGVADIYLFTGEAHGFWQRIGFRDITIDDWREPARQSWQWQYINEHREWAARFGLHTMWMRAST